MFCVQVYGIRVYGTPYMPLQGWAFFRAHGDPIRREWERIPTHDSATPIDVLLTHSPPVGHLDVVKNGMNRGQHVGCPALLDCVEQRVRPKFHVFGHIHENSGLSTNDETVFINASICNDRVHVVDRPIIFDLPLPEGHTKEEGG